MGSAVMDTGRQPIEPEIERVIENEVDESRHPCTRRHAEWRIRRMQSPSWLSVAA